MCRVSVQVVEVGDSELAVPWAVAVGEDGCRVLFVRSSAPPLEVAAGYATALRACPIRIALALTA